MSYLIIYMDRSVIWWRLFISTPLSLEIG